VSLGGVESAEQKKSRTLSTRISQTA